MQLIVIELRAQTMAIVSGHSVSPAACKPQLRARASRDDAELYFGQFSSHDLGVRLLVAEVQKSLGWCDPDLNQLSSIDVLSSIYG